MLSIRYLKHDRNKRIIKLRVVYYDSSISMYKTQIKTIRYKPKPSL